MSDNAFSRIMANLDAADQGVTEKTASERSGPSEDARARMLSTVRNVTNAATKTASAPAPQRAQVTEDLHRMAKQAQEAEAVQLTKQAHFLGSAVCDGFMERFAQYDGALAQQGLKTASANPSQGEPDRDTLYKVAQLAYGRAVEDMEKTAAVDYERGYVETMQAVHKIASDVHYVGQQVARDIVAEARK